MGLYGLAGGEGLGVRTAGLIGRQPTDDRSHGGGTLGTRPCGERHLPAVREHVMPYRAVGACFSNPPFMLIQVRTCVSLQINDGFLALAVQGGEVGDATADAEAADAEQLEKLNGVKEPKEQKQAREAEAKARKAAYDHPDAKAVREAVYDFHKYDKWDEAYRNAYIKMVGAAQRGSAAGGPSQEAACTGGLRQQHLCHVPRTCRELARGVAGNTDDSTVPVGNEPQHMLRVPWGLCEHVSQRRPRPVSVPAAGCL